MSLGVIVTYSTHAARGRGAAKCVQGGIMRYVGDPLGLHLNRKYLILGQKWLSFGQFTNGTLRDSNKNHVGCRRSIRASI